MCESNFTIQFAVDTYPEKCLVCGRTFNVPAATGNPWSSRLLCDQHREEFEKSFGAKSFLECNRYSLYRAGDENTPHNVICDRCKKIQIILPVKHWLNRYVLCAGCFKVLVDVRYGRLFPVGEVLSLSQDPYKYQSVSINNFTTDFIAGKL